MNTILVKRILGGFLGVVLCAQAFVPVFASASYTPTLNVYVENNNQVRVEVRSGHSYRQVDLYARPRSTNYWTVFTNIGQTDQSGFLSVSGYYGASFAGEAVDYYAMVGHDRTSTVTATGSGGCNYGNCGGSLSFSPQSVSVNSGQSAQVSIFGGNGNYYISNNSNSGIVSANISGNQLNVYGVSQGASTITVCSNYNQCGSVYVTVSGGSGSSGSITFSPTNPNLTVGQSLTVYLSSSFYNSSYYISSNSNSGVVSANISGNQLNLYGLSNGSSNIVVCGNANSCSTLYVNVSSGGNSGQISFSQTSVNIGTSQNITVNVYGGNGSYYISSNSNSNVASVSLNGSVLNVYGLNFGNTTIQVCSNNNGCGSIYVSVGGSGGQGVISFSQNNVNLNQGQTLQVTVYSNTYNPSFYVSNNEYPNIVGANISGSTLTLFGSSYGSSRVTVCGSSTGCGTLYVTVSGGNVYTQLALSQNNLNLAVGQSSTVTVYNASSANLYISSNSNPNVVSATLSNYLVTLYGINSGSSTISICSYNQSGCVSLYATVAGASGGSLTLLNSSITNLVVGQYTNQQLQGAGGQPPYIFSVNSGSLPSGLTLASNGYIAGTPQVSGSSTVYIRVVDSFNRSSSVPLYFSVSGGGQVGGNYTYRDGSLISDYGTIYIIYKGKKSAFTNYVAFRDLGFTSAMVVNGSVAGIPDSGYVISGAYGPHPWGAWIKSGKTVYFVHEEGLIPVPTAEAFYGNGGDWSKVVLANRYDLHKPLLPMLTLSDGRVQ